MQEHSRNNGNDQLIDKFIMLDTFTWFQYTLLSPMTLELIYEQLGCHLILK